MLSIKPQMAVSAWRIHALAAALIAPLAILLFFAPIPQDPRYHALADSRAMLGLPNFLNVASNAMFLAVGALGIALCVRGKCPGARLSWTAFFAAVALVAFGSGYYHWNPSDDTLAWDRLPMTVAFSALFAALVTEHLDGTREGPVLVSAIAVGVASIVWWRHADDLRFYVWVQLAPFLVIAVLLASFPARYSDRRWLVWGFGFYALAKVAEFGDPAIFSLTSGAVSGHTLKHLLAALAPLCVYRMLRVRRPLHTAPDDLSSSSSAAP
jgi:hypothetical protein